MTTAAHPHDVLLQELQEELAGIFAQSSQGVYVYLDDPHSIFSDRLVAMLGYRSSEELGKVASSSSFLDALVDPGSHQAVVDAYRKAVDAKVASTITMTWKKKGGETMMTEAIFVPLSFKGTPLALHFITPI